MEPRHYQAEAFDAARKSNVVMIGATGVGKVSLSAAFRILGACRISIIIGCDVHVALRLCRDRPYISYAVPFRP